MNLSNKYIFFELKECDNLNIVEQKMKKETIYKQINGIKFVPLNLH